MMIIFLKQLGVYMNCFYILLFFKLVTLKVEKFVCSLRTLVELYKDIYPLILHSIL